MRLRYISPVFRSITGPVTGQVYEFHGTTARIKPEFDINDGDASHFLGMTEKKGCCGSKRTQNIFVRVPEVPAEV